MCRLVNNEHIYFTVATIRSCNLYQIFSKLQNVVFRCILTKIEFRRDVLILSTIREQFTIKTSKKDK
jgi:hypothetical protein